MVADIRLARASDVDALLAIENAVFRTDRLSRRSFQHLSASATAAVLVAELAGEIAGYCILLFRSTVPSARLYSIAAAPRFSGRGVGRSLIEAAERQTLSRGKRSLRLEVRQDNSRAIAIYKQAGYLPIGSTPGYYADGMMAIRLEKNLAGRAKQKRASASKAILPGRSSLSRREDKTPRPAAR